jgi:hypothetical protein
MGSFLTFDQPSSFHVVGRPKQVVSVTFMLSEDGVAAMPAEAQVLLEKVASELGVSMEGLRQILKVTAQHMAEGKEGGDPSVSVEVLGEDDDEVEGREDAESSTGSVNGSDVDDLGDRFEGATA